MKTSERGIKAIAIREGEVLHGYKDSKGLLTVGVGHLVLPGEPYKLHQPITKEESRRLLTQDLKEAENAVNGSVKVRLAQHQFDALVSLTVNIGSAGFRRSSVVRRLNAKDYDGAAKAILMWNKPPEIQRRRHTEYDQFRIPYPVSAATPADSPTTDSPQSDEPISPNSAIDANSDPAKIEQPPTTEAMNATVEQTNLQASDGTSATSTTITEGQNVVVEKEEQVGFFKKIWKKLMGAIGSIGGANAVTDYAQQAQTFGLTPAFWKTIFWLIVGGVAIWLMYEGVGHLHEKWLKRKRTDTLVDANSTPTNSVMVIAKDDLAKYEKDGWIVIRRA